MYITPVYTANGILPEAFEQPHGQVLKVPLVMLNDEALPASHRIDTSKPFYSDPDWVALPGLGGGHISPWYPCTDGVPIVVSAVAGSSLTNVNVQVSRDGAAVDASLMVGNLNAHARAGFRFTSGRPYYRFAFAVSETCKGSLWVQQREPFEPFATSAWFWSMPTYT